MATQLLPEGIPLRAVPLLAAARSRTGYLLQLLGLAAACIVGEWLGHQIRGATPLLPLLSPLAGIAIAALLLLGPRCWPGVAAGVFVANLASGPASALTVAAMDTLAALAPALLLRRLAWTDATFERLRDVLLYLCVAGLVAPLLHAGLFSLEVWRRGDLQFSPVIAAAVFLSDLNGVVLVGALLLTWLGAQPATAPSAGRVELVTMAGGLVLVALLTQHLGRVYIVPTFPLLAWAALRAGPRGSTLVCLSLFATTVWATVWGETLITRAEANQLFFLLGLNVTQGITGLLLAASVAERRQADQVEREIKDAYRALVAAAPFAVVGLDRAGRATLWSRAAEQLFGWRADEVLGRSLPTIPPSDREGLGRVSSGPGALSGHETVRLRRDGSELDILLTAWPMYDSAGRLSGVMEVHQDITERKRAERLQLATYRISQAALTAPDLEQLYAAIHGIVSELMPARNLHIALYDAATDTLHFPYWSDERDAQPAPRRARRGLIEDVIRTGRALRDRPALIGSLVERGEVESFGATASDWLGVPLRARDRTIGALAVQSYEPSVRYTDREQAILEFVSSQVAMAIERKQAEDAVRASEKELRALFAAMRDVILVIDRAGTYLRVAPTSPDLLAAAAADLVGRRFHDVLPGEQADSFLEVVERTLANGQPAALEYQIAIQGGREVWFSAVVSPLDAATVLWVARSIDQQKQAEAALRRSEEQLRQALKMEAVGRLAGGVAHDFNNLLTSVLGHADLGLNRLMPGDPLHDDLLEIKSAGARAASLTQQLLAFSRKQVLEPRVVDLNAVVSGIVRMLRRTIGEDIELLTRLAPDLGAVRADPVQLEQVLLNLAVNARDAMPHGGRLTIETSNVPLSGGSVARVRVQDTGVGMTDEVRAHLFEPFFTTKDVGKGTGLGLATAYGIVQQSGGTISASSAPGEGTTFVVDLPLVHAEISAPEREPQHGSGHGSETVLLVEDEDAVRNLTRRALEYHGYRVLSAPNAEAALDISRLHGAPLHLLLTDIVMPGMSGTRLAEQLRAERPGLRIVFMSGYAATTLGQDSLLQQEASFLQKPFTTEQLTHRIREVLDGPEGAGQIE